jgi:hypothetical protein
MLSKRSMRYTTYLFVSQYGGIILEGELQGGCYEANVGPKTPLRPSSEP